MKILVTGAAGFIGSWLSYALRNSGHQVMGVDNMSLYQRITKIDDVDRMLIDDFKSRVLWDNKGFAKTIHGLEKPDMVVHLAADPREYEPGSLAHYKQYIGDLDSTYEVVMMAHKYALPIVYASSVFAYKPFDHVCHEGDELEPVGAYGITKAAGEYLVKSMCEKHLIFRTTSVYGMGDLNNRATSIIMKNILRGLPVKCNVNSPLDFTYVEDLVRELVVMIENFKIGTFNVTGGKAYSLEEYAKVCYAVAEIEPQIEEYFEPDRPRRGTMANHKKANVFGLPEFTPLSLGVTEYYKLAKKWGVA